MSKNNQGAPTEAHAVEVETPQGELFCLVQLLVDTCYNGRSLPAGATIGNVPHAIAQRMAGFRTARIVGTPHTINSNRPRDLDAIENQIPDSLGLDSSQWQPACPVVGQPSSVFVNLAELEALQNRS